jgi:hypothetical protein
MSKKPKVKHVIKIIRCNEQVAAYYDEKLVYQTDIDPEALCRLCDLLGWKFVEENVTEKEYTELFA